MSYLNSPRLTFSGQFQADPSTVNNDPTHFNNETFKKRYQYYSDADHANGWWNPDGTGNWRFIGCKITQVTYSDGTSTDDPTIDPIIGMSIMDTDARTAGKIVDLDSEQQSVSELWGLIVRIVSPDGTEMMRGDYEVAPFTNLWFTRSVDQSKDGAAAAVYQSVVKNLSWNKKYKNSRYLNELRESSKREISINFTVDRYVGDSNSPQFTLGRIAGSVGPTNNQEPERFTLARQLFPPYTPPSKPPITNIMYAVALVDEEQSHIILDLGNSLQFSSAEKINETRDLRLAINTGTATAPNYTEIGRINYDAPGWYMKTAGVSTFPLSAEQLKNATKFPLCIISAVSTPNDVFTKEVETTYSPVFVESVDYVRADQFVYRLDPGDKCSIKFYATRLGKPLAKAKIHVQDGTATIPNLQIAPNWPKLGTPEIEFFKQKSVREVTTDERGMATLSFDASDPGNPRKYIDGQVYGLSYNLSTQDFTKDCNQNNFISMLIFSGPPMTDIVPDWDNFIQPIMTQYANLYPLMSKGVFNLADKNVVDKNAEILQLVFSKDRKDPNYMPATRDLSGYKSKVILDYLQTVIDSKN